MALRAHLLDLSRLYSRLGRDALTGIDRVELAYLTQFLNGENPMYGIIRRKYGFALLDRSGCASFRDAVIAGKPCAAKPIARILRPFLPVALRRLPRGTIYWNVGHANLTPQVLGAARRAGVKVAVLIHDTIPLDYPHFTRAGQSAPFARKLQAVAQSADLVIHISNDTRAKTEAHFAAMGRVPAGVTAHLGAEIAAPIAVAMKRPYFITIGTIEPRKNHALLLDVWEKLGTGPDVPTLVVLGARGWAAPDLFARLDRAIATGHVIHHAAMDDGQAMGLLSGARALLFPTFAEGFGLPPIEALALGTPVIAADLPVLREVLGDKVVYLEPSDSYSWMETIRAMSQFGDKRDVRHAPPLWADHLKTVLTAVR